MSNRPAQIRFLTEGKALGAAVHKGWAATWNWVLSWVNHLKGGRGVTVKNRHSGYPVVEALIEAGDGIDVTCGGDGQPWVISATGGGGGPEEQPEQYVPDITATSLSDGTHIYVDGADIATIPHGKTPVITATKADKTTTIYADDVPLCAIQDGEDGKDGDDPEDSEEEAVVTGVSFSIHSGKLFATVKRKNVKVLTATDIDDEEVEVCAVKDVTVVTSEDYSTISHQFTNERRTVKVLGSEAAEGQTPFTATPHSGE